MLQYKFKEGDNNIHKGLKEIKKKFMVVLKEYRSKQFYERKAEKRRKEIMKAVYKNKTQQKIMG